MSDLTATGAEPAPAPATTVAPTTPEPSVPTIDDTLEAAWDKAQTGNERAPDGQFAGKEKTEAPPGQQAVTEKTVQSPSEKAEPAPPAIEPPQSWTAEAKANVWPNLPPDTQAYILKRESEAHKAISSYGERVKSYEPLDQVITRYQDSIARRGMTPAQAFAFLLGAQQKLDADPLSGLVEIGLSYGYDLRPLLNGQQASLPAPDPRVGQVEHKLGQIEQTIQQQQRHWEEQQTIADTAMVREFAKDKPYFEDVRADMAQLFTMMNPDGSPKYPTLDDAYKAALRINDSVRARVETSERAAAEQKRQENAKKAEDEARAKATDAQKAARLNVKSGTGTSNPKTMDDTIEEIARRTYG